MVKKFSILFFVLFFLSGAQNASAVVDCSVSGNIITQADKDFCYNELTQTEAQLADLLNQQKEQQKRTGTLKGDITYLTTQINALKTKIKARSLAIAQLKISITSKVNKIETLSEKIKKEHQSLAQLLRNTNEIDNENMVHLIFSNSSVSDFYSDFYTYASIKQSIKTSVEQINGIKTQTEAEKKDLEKKQNAELDTKSELENAQKKVVQTESNKKELLAISKKKESDYQKLADEKKARANKIRGALFSLAGISQKIDFGTALQYATEAKSKTGIDPAFLLAILTQESNLGSNVGKCYLTNIDGPQAGYGVNISTGKTWNNLMKPTRDIAPFLEITGKLGFDPLKTVVSCPIAGVKGYGGAMGPAQFIASTWKLIEKRIASSLGISTPNPWNPRDAFMASAIYLTDLGASGTSYSSQIKAACKYYGTGGSNCSYGKSVMNFAKKIQINQIDPLQGI
jgi:membrane-bound lytic murein transglycosylase B